MKVLFDGDVIAYRAAAHKVLDPFGGKRDCTILEALEKVDDIINLTFDNCGIPFWGPQDYSMYITGKTNFRYKVADDYKGNRKDVQRPEHLPKVREYLLEKYNAEVSIDEEADDLISKEATLLKYDCIIATVDKDLKQIPCGFYNFMDCTLTQVSKEDAEFYFWQQVLTGDRVDAIEGLKGVGPKKSEKILEGTSGNVEYFNKCLDTYKEHGKTEEDLLKAARLLWLRRYEGQLVTLEELKDGT